MKRYLPVALMVAGCLLATAQWPAQTPAAAQNKPDSQSQPPAASQSSANPFPEDTADVPVMPSKSTPELPEGTYNGAENAPLPLPGEDRDPVRSPDDPEPSAASGTAVDSSSSLAGVDTLLPKPEDDQPGKKRKLVLKEPTHQEASSKDIEVGDYYLQTKNWKAAYSRFESARVLDPENPEVYWGLAEAEHHLGEFARARENYLKLLDYDPDGPHGKQARKELKDPALVNAKDAAPSAASGEAPK
jgi:tetratricopeptide (TPR) repeat protein